MACDASLPGHTVQLPHECKDEEERFQHVVGQEEMSFCPYHYSLYCAIVLRSFSIVVGDMLDSMNHVVMDTAETLDGFARAYYGERP